MCVYMHVYIYAHLDICFTYGVYAYTHMCCMHACIYVSVYLYIYLYASIYIHMYIYISDKWLSLILAGPPLKSLSAAGTAERGGVPGEH